MEDVLNASKTGDLQQTITDLPEGLSTLVGPNREPLSGGQQQRIAIARARLRDAPILILDEATCALDQTSKRKVMEEIRKWREKKTTIVITHDTSQIHDDEYVYVLDHGNLVQEGYRRDFVEKKHGTFVSFHPVYARGNSTVLEQRRKSGLTSPTCLLMGDIDEVLGVCWNRPSNKFGTHESDPQSSNVNSNPQRNRNLSQDVRAFSTNELNLSQQAIPVPPAEIFQSPRLGYFRLNALGFLSPCTLSRASFRDLPRRSSLAERAIMNLPVAECAIMAEAGKTRPIPPTINTSAIKHQPSPLRVEQGVTSPTNAAPTPKKPLETTPSPYVKILKSIWPTLSGTDRIFFVLGFFFAFIVAAATPAFAYVFARLLGIYYLENDRVSQAKLWALALVGISIVDGAATFCTHYFLEHSGQAWVSSLRVEAFKRILAQPLFWFEIEENSAARLSACLDRNAEEMRNLVGRFAGPIFTTIWMLGISIVWAFLISWKLSLVAMGCLPVVWAATSLFSHISSKWEERCNVLAGQTGDIFTETFSNIRVVRAFTLESYFKQKHMASTTRTYKTGLSRALYSGAAFGIGEAISFFITATIFYYGTVITTRGVLPVSAVLAVVNLLLFGLANSMSILSLIPQLSSSRVTVTRMIYLANLPLHSHEFLGTHRLATPFPIHFNNLSFTYPSRPHQPTLSSFTLTLTPGSRTALVGPSGSGKSTLASLILALYPPDPVAPHHPAPLTFAGIPVTSCNISSLRSHIAIVPQSPTLFPATILENIIYGLPEGSPLANLNAATLAARDAGIDEFVSSLPNGYQTLVGDGGQGLSGGQTQRLAIARALFRRPKVLILDEATSVLDAISAGMVRETISKLVERGQESGAGGMAVLVIAHGVEMMRIWERIVVLEGGQIAEVGSFDELKGRGGAFARLIGGWGWW